MNNFLKRLVYSVGWLFPCRLTISRYSSEVTCSITWRTYSGERDNPHLSGGMWAYSSRGRDFYRLSSGGCWYRLFRPFPLLLGVKYGRMSRRLRREST